MPPRRKMSRRLGPAVDDFVRLRILSSLPIEFQSYLHLSRVVCLSGHQAEGSAVQVRAGQRESRAVQHVERLPAKIDAFAFVDHEALSHADVLVEAGEGSQLRIIPCYVAKLIARLGRKNAFVQE